MAIGKVEYFEPRGDLNCPHGEIVLFLLIFESTAFEHADQMLVLSEEATILLFVDLYIVLHWKFRTLTSCIGRFFTSFVFEFILSLSPSHPSPCASSTQSPFEDVISSSPILIKPIYEVFIQVSSSAFSKSLRGVVKKNLDILRSG